jgi:hypothetical protein
MTENVSALQADMAQHARAWQGNRIEDREHQVNKEKKESLKRP